MPSDPIQIAPEPVDEDSDDLPSGVDEDELDAEELDTDRIVSSDGE